MSGMQLNSMRLSTTRLNFTDCVLLFHFFAFLGSVVFSRGRATKYFFGALYKNSDVLKDHNAPADDEVSAARLKAAKPDRGRDSSQFFVDRRTLFLSTTSSANNDDDHDVRTLFISTTPSANSDDDHDVVVWVGSRRLCRPDDEVLRC